MTINRLFNPMRRANGGSLLGFNVFRPTFIGKPVEAIANQYQTLGDRANRIVDDTSMLDMALSNLDIAEGDLGAQALRNEQAEIFKQGVSEISSSGDYNLAEAKINQLSKQFQQNKGLQQAVENKQAYDAYRERQRERFEEGEITPLAYQHAINQAPPQTIQREDGFYERYNPADLIGIYDFNKDIDKFSSDFRETIGKTPLQFTRNELGEIVGTQQTRIARNNLQELYKGLKARIVNNPEAFQSAQQEASLQGISTEQFIDNLIEPTIRQKSGQTVENLGQLFRPLKEDEDKEGRNRFAEAFGIQALSSAIGVEGEQDNLINILQGKQQIGENKLVKSFTGTGNKILEALDVVPQSFKRIGQMFGVIDKDIVDPTTIPLEDKQAKVEEIAKNIDISNIKGDNLIKVNNVLTSLGIDKELNNLTPEEKAEYLPKVVDFMQNTYNNDLIASVGDGQITPKEAEVFNLNLFNDKDGRLKIGKDGNFISSGKFDVFKVYDEEYGEMSGREFIEKMNDGDIKEVKDVSEVSFSPLAMHDFRNPIYDVTQNPTFLNTTSYSLNGRIIYVSNPVKLSQEDGSAYTERTKGDIYKSRRNPRDVMFINRNVEGNKMKALVSYNNKTGIYTAAIKDEDGVVVQRVTGNSEQELMDTILNLK